MKPVGNFLTRKVVKAVAPGGSLGEFTPITIHLDGSIEPRKIQATQDFRMALYSAEPGDVVVSKIDLKHGAVGVLPTSIPRAVVTNHFAVYEPDLNQIEPRFFHLLVQSDPVKDLLWRNKVGAEGRKEVKLEFFENMLVPVPSLETQRSILAYWDRANDACTRAESKLERLVLEMDSALRSRTANFEGAAKSRSFIASHASAAQWDIKAGRASAFIVANPSFIRFGDYIEECSESVDPQSRPEHRWPVYGVSNRRGVFLNSHQLGSEFNSRYKKIEPGWFFHNPTRANVGSLGMVPAVPADAVTSPEYQVWRLHGDIDRDYVALLISTEYFRELVAFNRVGAVKQRMYFANLAEVRLPDLDRSTQRDLGDQRRRCLQMIEEKKATLESVKANLALVLTGEQSIEDVSSQILGSSY